MDTSVNHFGSEAILSFEQSKKVNTQATLETFFTRWKPSTFAISGWTCTASASSASREPLATIRSAGTFWKDGCFRKQRSGKKGKRQTCKECPLRSWRPVELTTILRHLRGEIIVGIYPLFADDSCRFLVFDFDNHDTDASYLDSVRKS